MGLDAATIRFETADGVALEGDVAVPERPRAAAVVCHPHPRYGGDRHHPIVASLHEALPAIGVASLRFDVRPDADRGDGARLDTEAALREVVRRADGAPAVVLGYSFGARTALDLVGSAPGDDGVGDRSPVAAIAIAPPLGHGDPPGAPTAPTLLIVAGHDRFAPLDVVRPIVDGWARAEVRVLGTADHFLAGHVGAVTSASVEWLAAVLDGRAGR